ncbi:PAS domain-containing protein [Plasmodiophora brassicae]|uniref:TmcB/TmcC TPR repeats domain-containing protein n=1 Tax=Plasmodiophora brassicae TaxID=37360 RepID=A0A0G4IRM1_PLABS|nr:hypothetical protein PBRA_006137 [Plasmodiophora brassicae]
MANSVVSFASRHTGLNDAAADSDSFDVASSGVGRWKDNARRNVDGFIRLLNDAPPMTSSPAISVLVTSIEYLQLLSLLFLADDPIGWRGSAARAFGPVIGASRLDMITDRPSIALAWTVQVAIVAVAIIAPMAGSRHRRKVAIGAAATTVIAGVSHMATTILFVPIICILINSTACGSAASCYEAQHIAVVTGAMITLIVFSAYSVTIVAIVFEQRPLKSQITAGPHRTANIARVILILTTAIMLGMGQSLPVAVVITFLLAITLQAIFVAYLFAMTLPYYSIRYAQFTAACAWIVAWAATCKLVNAFTSGASSDAGAFVAFVAGIPLIAFAAVLISEVRRSAVATRAPAQLKSALEFEMKIRLLLQYDGDHDKLAEAEQLWTDALSRFPNSVSMYMYRGAFYQHRMHRPFLALKMYSKAASISKVILDQILCRRGMDSVAETQESSEGTHVLRFESNLALARKQDAEATNTLISFWDEVGQDTPNVVQLRLLMGKMSEEMSKTETLYESVFDSFSDDIYSLRAYAGFMLYVVKDTTRGNELLEQANALEDAVSKQTTSASRIQGGSKGAANEAVVLLSVDDGDLGAIVNISAKACTMIGRVKSDLVRRHFAMVTPLAFHKRIVDLFETLAENMDTESFDTGQRLPMLHASGALLVATLSLKCVVDDERLHILGTICPEPDANAVAMVEIQADTSKPPVLICCTNDFGAFFGIDPGEAAPT